MSPTRLHLKLFALKNLVAQLCPCIPNEIIEGAAGPFLTKPHQISLQIHRDYGSHSSSSPMPLPMKPHQITLQIPRDHGFHQRVEQGQPHHEARGGVNNTHRHRIHV